ncbi:MAG: hypothetical protein SO210_01470, partial [Bacteroidaceae bacterium]|nr:hypothetical protein [Bacteroidaceae bacterium]
CLVFFAVISIGNTMTYKSGFFSGFMGQIFALCRAKPKPWLGVWAFKLKWLFLPKQKTIKHEK